MSEQEPLPQVESDDAADDAEELRIERHVVPGTEIYSCDFTLVGLSVDSWRFERGARTHRDYLLESGDVAVRDSFDYLYSDGERVIDEVVRTIRWYREDGTEGLQKNLPQNHNKKYLKALNRDVRQGRIDYLEATAEELLERADIVPEPYKSQFKQVAASMEVLFSHYRDESLDYVQRGTRSLEDAIRVEENEAILAIMQIPTVGASAKFPNGLNVKGSLLYQLTGEVG